MTIDVVSKQIKSFLASEIPEVLAIKGRWGVGKTFGWNKLLGEAISNDQVALTQYSYVSLFGLNSIDAFKSAIFENVVSQSQVGGQIDINNQNKFVTAKAFIIPKLVKYRDIPILKNFTPAINSLASLSLNGTLICVDDLERRGASLTIKDIFGLISLLKEQKQCKIVMLLNDNEVGMEDYFKYSEKVIDIELKFEPTAIECAAIAFKDNSQISESLKNFSIQLNIKNIRILKKVERLVKITLPFVQDLKQEISTQVLHTLTLFSLCYYGSDLNTYHF